GSKLSLRRCGAIKRNGALISSVLPSAGARATASVPIMVPAPGRVSMTNERLLRRPTWSVSNRAMRSPAPPGGTGSTTLMTPLSAPGEVRGFDRTAAKTMPAASQHDRIRAIIRPNDFWVCFIPVYRSKPNLKYIRGPDVISFSYEAGPPPARLRRLCPPQIVFGGGRRAAHQPARGVQAHRRSRARGRHQA